ncbi:HipA domain-containing protein [Bermanella sp. WJH001]|uniref:HipA domain-containing protein n=1 Tax=Bermanella sp. WJH001 TaxID=3048005 RepID=UPI0024BE22EE|nr:HipA domain-containing protein [Bermanella sp. WJH001]MDJ1537436.1 HipA domain-containing protein [Bermanella sp. WJH001]
MTVFDVYLHGQKAGKLTFDKRQRMTFEYDGMYCMNHQKPIAFSMPVPVPPLTKIYTDEIVLPFIENLFPEGEIDQKIRVQNKIADGDFKKLVTLMGRDVAGAISILNEDETPESTTQIEPPLNTKELSHLLLETNRTPYNLTNQNGRRLSLAGAQNKLPITIVNEEIFLSGGQPSTHILKPTPSRKEYEQLVYNEYFCMRLCSALGINTAKVALIEVYDEDDNESDCLCVTRYDRDTQNKNTQRIHQEDFCQLTGHLSSQKYDHDNGMDFPDLITFIRENCQVPIQNIDQCVNLFIFNIIIGNCDAHAKNYSFLHNPPNKLKLAPAYDIVCTKVFEELDTNLAMGVNGEYQLTNITKEDIAALANDIGIRNDYLTKKFKDIANRIQHRADELIQEFEDGDYYPNTLQHVKLIRACIRDNIRVLREAGIV